jgi:hypothetical protein
MTDLVGDGSNPAPLTKVEKLQALWDDPEYRIKMQYRNMVAALDRKIDPQKFKRTGIPNGKTRKQADKLWAKARGYADRFIQIMTDKGELPADEDFFLDADLEKHVIPNTDEGMAKAGLREVFVLAIGPSEQKTKIAALNTLLAYTKSKPESKSKLTLSKAEDFLNEIAESD